MEIRWFKKGKCSRFCYKDVRLSVSKNSTVSYITFFNGAYERITDSDNLIFGISGDRLYFKGGDSVTGYKSVTGAKSRRIVLFSDEFIEYAKKHKSEFDLEYDVENNLYYIEDKESRV